MTSDYLITNNPILLPCDMFFTAKISLGNFAGHFDDVVSINFSKYELNRCHTETHFI